MNTTNKVPLYYYKIKVDNREYYIDRFCDLRFENDKKIIKQNSNLYDIDYQYLPNPIKYRGFVPMIADAMYFIAKYRQSIDYIEIRNFKNKLVCTIDRFDKVPEINWYAVKMVFDYQMRHK